MNFSDFIPYLAAHLGVSGSTLVFLFFCINQGSKVIGRRIPNDATGFWAQLRIVCTILGADPSSVVTTTPAGKSVTVQDVATQAAATPPIDAKVAAASETTT